MINYDLPWNPMKIEQRIGRIHRIGQEKEVRIFNLCSANSIEDYILDILDRKINMFEMVIGEIEMILGRVQRRKGFFRPGVPYMDGWGIAGRASKGLRPAGHAAQAFQNTLPHHQTAGRESFRREF
jgi:hypothetical protein